jgi:hypothetical protein
VLFVDSDGYLLAPMQKIKSGHSAVPPVVTPPEDHVFVGWDSTEYLAVTRDLVITAMFNRIVPIFDDTDTVEQDVSVTPGQSADKVFKDVSAKAWYFEAVNFIWTKGITQGTSPNTFEPEKCVSRGQALTLLMRACGVPPMSGGIDNFSDAGDTYYTGYLATAKKLGVSSGIGNNRFAPERTISRQEVFGLLFNLLNFLDELPLAQSDTSLSHFADSKDVAIWAKEPIKVLVQAGIVGGDMGYLYPTQTCTRAEIAQVLYKLLSN